MKPTLLLMLLACSYVACCASDSQSAARDKTSSAALDHRIPAGNASLCSREIGQGQPSLLCTVEAILTTSICCRIWTGFQIRTG